MKLKVPKDSAVIFRAAKYEDPDLPDFARDMSESDVAAVAANYDAAYSAAPLTIDHVADGPAFAWVKSLSAQGKNLVAQFEKVTPAFRALWRQGYLRKLSAHFAPDLNGRGVYLMEVSALGAKEPRVKGLPQAEFAAIETQRTPTGRARIDIEITPESASFAALEDTPEERRDNMNEKELFMEKMKAAGLTDKQAEAAWAAREQAAGDDKPEVKAPEAKPPEAAPAPAATVEKPAVTDAGAVAPATFAASQRTIAALAGKVEAQGRELADAKFAAIIDPIINGGILPAVMGPKLRYVMHALSTADAAAAKFAAPDGAASPMAVFEELLKAIPGKAVEHGELYAPHTAAFGAATFAAGEKEQIFERFKGELGCDKDTFLRHTDTFMGMLKDSGKI